MKFRLRILFKIKIVFYAVGLVLLFSLTSGAATQVLLEWQPNTEPDLAGYRVFTRLDGERYNYAEPSWEGTQTSCVVDIPEEGLLNFFVVRAFSATGSTSSDSGEVCYGCTPCPDDPDKIYAGVCGCGVPDKDIDVDGIWDCYDTDDDNDTIDDILEANGPNQGDGNLDGISDSLQCNVGSLPGTDGGDYVVLESTEGTCINFFNRVSNPSPEGVPQDIEFELGLYEYEIHNIEPGNVVTVTIILPGGVTPDTYYSYGMVPENQTDHWYEFLDDGDTGMDINGNILTIYFVDGLPGDNLLNIDSRIRHIGGPGFIPSDAINNNNTDIAPDNPDMTNSDTGCFFNCLSQ